MSLAFRISPHPSLATAPATIAQRRLAFFAVMACLACFCATAPFAHRHLAAIPAFVPAYETGLAVTDFLTAALLFSQFSRLRRPGLLAVAGGYLFIALLIVAHVLSFPGVFGPHGVLGGGYQTTSWLFTFWHGGFPLFVAVYGLTADRAEIRRAGPAMALTIAGVMAAALAVTVLCTAGEPLLPVVLVNGDFSRMVTLGISPIMLAFSAAALAVIWRRRSGTVLDLWLGVVLWVWIFDVSLSAVIGSSRYDLGWYGGRTFGLLGGGVLLAALLIELNALYDRLAEALAEAEAQNLALAESRAELARVQRMEAIGRLTGGIAHDFNNLLTAIIGGLDMILRHTDKPERVARLAGNAAKAAERGAQLVAQLQTFAAKRNLRPEVLNPNAVITGFDTLTRRAAGEAVALTLGLDASISSVRVDAAEFQAAILNLVSNARDAMPSGGDLTITSRNVQVDARSRPGPPDLAPGAYVLVEIADTGLGMDAQTLAQIFEPFFTTKSVGKGTGLGLSQVYGFAKSAGGHVAVTSRLGAGTRAAIYLPQVEGELLAPSAATPDFPLRRAREGERVLLVEDDADVMASATENLQELGYEVLTATSGPDGLATLMREDNITILFSDVVMPGGMNGVQLAQEARRVRPGLKVLLTSGYTGEALQDHGALDEAFELLTKPYKREELAHKLRLVLGEAA